MKYKKISFSALGAVVLTLAIASNSAVAAPSDAAATTTPIPTATAIATPIPTATATPAEPTATPAPVPATVLKQYGIKGHVTDQTDAGHGATITDYSDSHWVLQLPATATSEMKKATSSKSRIANAPKAADFQAAFCVGTFVDMVRVAQDELFWGGQSSCTAAQPSDFYPHSLRVRLRKKVGLEMNTIREKTSTDSPYNGIQTVNHFPACTSDVTHQYDMVAWDTVHGVEYGPIDDTEEYKIGCNVNAG